MHTVSACLETYIIVVMYMPVGMHMNIHGCTPTHVTCLPKESYMHPPIYIWTHVSVWSFGQVIFSQQCTPVGQFSGGFTELLSRVGAGVYLGG